MLRRFPDALEVEAENKTPVLHFALLSGSVTTAEDIFKIYLKLINITDKTKTNLLHVAVQSGNVDVIRLSFKILYHQITARNANGLNL